MYVCAYIYTREGNGNPLQYSCLENPRDRGAWWAAIYGVAQSQTQLKWLSSSSIYKHTHIHIPASEANEFPFSGIFSTSIWQCSKFSALHHPCVSVHTTQRHTLTHTTYTHTCFLFYGRSVSSFTFSSYSIFLEYFPHPEFYSLDIFWFITVPY